jgi:hypothetical protein
VTRKRAEPFDGPRSGVLQGYGRTVGGSAARLLASSCRSLIALS